MLSLETPALRPAVGGLPGYVAGRRAQTARTAALASNESHEPPLPAVLEAITTAAGAVNRYPDMAATVLREALASRCGVEVDQVAVGPGSVAVLQQIITAFAGEGDEVLFAWRSFEAYPILTRIAGATAVQVPLGADEGHDLPAMLAAITPATKVVLLCTPNNPTGVPIPSPELVEFLTAAPAGVVVVIDEAYLEYGPDPSGRFALDLLAAHPNLCVLRTLSKAWGLAGLRVGYAVAAPAVAEGLRRTAIPFGVSSIAQAAALAALSEAPAVLARAAAVVAERDRLVTALRANGWTLPESAANFVWLRCTGADFEEVMAAFDAAEILVRGYPADGVRISLADPVSNDRVLAVLTDPALRARR